MLGSSSFMTFVATTDFDKARAFYGDVLGLKPEGQDEYALVFSANGVILRISKVRELVLAPYTVLGWQVPDIAATIRELVSRGVVFERYGFIPQDELGVANFDGARVAWFKDPDGNTLSLTQFG